MLSVETLQLAKWKTRAFIYTQGKGIESRGQLDQLSSVSIKRHNAYTKRSCTAIMGEGSGLAICMRPRGDTIPILADASLLPAHCVELAAFGSCPARDTEAMALCGNHMTMPLSGTSMPSSRHANLIFSMFNHSPECLEMAITDG